MKRLFLLLICAPVAFAATQKQQLTYRDSKREPRVIIQGDDGFVIPDESFELKGNVSFKHIPEGFSMTCAKATGVLIKVGGKKEFDKVRLTGGVHATKTGVKEDISAKGNSASYDLDGANRKLKLEGSVALDFKAKAGATSIWNVTASSANLVMRSTDSILDSANLAGPLVFDGLQAGKDGKATKLKIKAQSMSYTVKGESGHREVRLEKNIEMSQDGVTEDAEITGAQLLVLELNDAGEVTKIRFSSGGGDDQIKTVIRQGKKGGI